jgi:nitroimidazol reductase NimA-like FMN-containing flavoprotein (pyridoxamine 5'-phosphate oxidase superfamily)
VACNNRRMPPIEAGRGTDGDPGPGTDRVRLRRLADQGSHRRADLEVVLDAGFICHLGLEVDGWPMVVPTTYGRSGGHLYLHGSVASRSLRTAKAPVPVCVTVTLVDGLVLARSVFNHSVNYRCAMVYGLPQLLVDPDEKLAGLETICEHAVPGQWAYARSPSAKELAATTVLRIALDEASVKVSEGPPDDDVADLALDVWAGVLPLRTVRLEPVAAPDLADGTALPEHIAVGPLAPGSDALRDLG